MKRSARLEIVEKLAKQREDQAAQALAQVRAQLEIEGKRLQELADYQTEYMGYLDKQGAAGISMQQWRRTQGFIDQLADLAQRQQIAIDGWLAREEQVLEKWRLLYQRRKNIGQYITKLSIEEVLAEDKKEQKMLDELISQRFR